MSTYDRTDLSFEFRSTFFGLLVSATALPVWLCLLRTMVKFANIEFWKRICSSVSRDRWRAFLRVYFRFCSQILSTDSFRLNVVAGLRLNVAIIVSKNTTIVAAICSYSHPIQSIEIESSLGCLLCNKFTQIFCLIFVTVPMHQTTFITVQQM